MEKSSQTEEMKNPPVAEELPSAEVGALEAQPEITHSLDRAREHLLAYIVSRLPSIDEKLIGDAIDFTVMAHHNQFRRSGMPYAEHPFEVAKILTDLQMDSVTIAAGLLHDVAEDTIFGTEEITKRFGEQVAFLVEGVTKISEIQVKSRAERQAETFRKMLISVAKDFRVIMIKFADRLHNMRTLNYLKEERKKAIAQETIEVYAPLAHRFGLARVKWELEDLSFKYLNPDIYKGLVKKVVSTRREREEYTKSISDPIRELLRNSSIAGRVFGRPKHLYSIYRKMQSRDCSFEDLYDLYGLRVIVKTISDCYAVLGLVHALWTPLQSRFKDYIATPKSNLYQSLHTTLIGPAGRTVEIQIRTEEMDLTAERGIAAHWAYKEGKPIHSSPKGNPWLQQFMDWQKDLTDSSEFMDFFRGDLAPGEIFVFTPQGDLFQLPKGSTALDFAFAVHSQVGIHAIGARVDGNLVPLHRPLKTGSRVEILKSGSQHPSRDWLSMVVTTKAKSVIRRWLRSEESSHFRQLGRELMSRELRLARSRSGTHPAEKDLCIKFDTESINELHEKLGRGEITLGSLSNYLQSLATPKSKPGVFERVRLKRNPEPSESVVVSGMHNMLIQFANCCQPVPGDTIIGYVTKGRGVSIHRSDCPEGMLLMRDEERIVPVQWRSDIKRFYTVQVEVTGKERPDLLKEITSIFSRMKINVVRATIISHKNLVRNRFRIEVADLNHLRECILSLKKVKGITGVSRKKFFHSD